MNKQRLLKLADFLETKVKKSWFDMDKFADIGFKDKECGTQACAVGWMPSCFPKKGLELKEDRVGWGSVNLFYKKGKNVYKNTPAVMKFLEITELAVDHLFMAGSAYYGVDNPTPKRVAKVIRKFVTTNGDIDKAFQ